MLINDQSTQKRNYGFALLLRKVKSKGKGLMIKIGLISGEKISTPHIEAINNSSDFELIGHFNPTKKKNTTKFIPTFDELLSNSDAIGILAPTFSHYEYASKAIRNLKHVFVENPISKTLDEAKSLLSLSEEAAITVQIGHAERFNPALISVRNIIENPVLIEARRYETKNNSNKKSVVLDLMIHDIDIIMMLVKSPVKRVRANGFSTTNNELDVVNARLEFDNGCVANLSASKVASKEVKKLHVFEPQKHFNIDFKSHNTTIINLKTGNKEALKTTNLSGLNSTEKEFKSFANAINEGIPLDVSISNGYDVLSVATQIYDRLKVNSNISI